jgi:hypothetical protein
VALPNVYSITLTGTCEEARCQVSFLSLFYSGGTLFSCRGGVVVNEVNRQFYPSYLGGLEFVDACIIGSQLMELPLQWSDIG